MIELSVVIPTFSRVGLLLWCLEEYKNQSLAKDKFEIVVVNDGGAEIPQEDYPYNIKFVSQENKGPAAARNLGVKNASGKTVLFVGIYCTATGTHIAKKNSRVQFRDIQTGIHLSRQMTSIDSCTGKRNLGVEDYRPIGMR